MKYILIFLLSIIAFAAYAAPPVKDVNVVNTPDVNVVNMPPVEVTVPGALDVNVQNTPGVTIVNGQLEPVPVEITNQSGSEELVNIILGGNFPLGSNSLTEFSLPTSPPITYQVPTGKIFIVRHYTCTVEAFIGGQEVNLFLNTRVENSTDQNAYRGGSSSGALIPLMLTHTFTSSDKEFYAANKALDFVVGGVTNSGTVSLWGRRNVTEGANTVICIFTGDLTDL